MVLILYYPPPKPTLPFSNWLVISLLAWRNNNGCWLFASALSLAQSQLSFDGSKRRACLSTQNWGTLDRILKKLKAQEPPYSKRHWRAHWSFLLVSVFQSLSPNRGEMHREFWIIHSCGGLKKSPIRPMMMLKATVSDDDGDVESNCFGA